MDDKIEGIKASDLLKLMTVVEKATGLWNTIERRATLGEMAPWLEGDYVALGEALRELGLTEVTP